MQPLLSYDNLTVFKILHFTVDSLRKTAVKTHEKHQREDNFMVKEGR